MPMYSWRDEVSGIHVDIIRKFDLSEDPPKREDITEKEMSDEQFAAAKWTKVLSAPDFVRMPGWGGRKGYW